MVTLYSGTPGSGKSTHMAMDIINNHQEGRITIANFPVDLSSVRRHFHNAPVYFWETYEITPQRLKDFSRKTFHYQRPKEGSIQLFIDEAQLIFNCRDWDAQTRKEWIEFFTQHRKYGYDIILVAQYDRMLDRQIRGIIEDEIKHRKLANYGLQGKFLSLLLGGRTCFAVRYWYQMKIKTDTMILKFRNRYFKIFDTFRDFKLRYHIIRPEITLKTKPYKKTDYTLINYTTTQ